MELPLHIQSKSKEQLESYMNTLGYKHFFIWACKNGHLELAKYLYSIKTNFKISFYAHQMSFINHKEISINNNNIFDSSDESDDENNDEGDDKSDDESDDESDKELDVLKHAFIFTCKNGHLEVAQWLLSVISDVYPKIEYRWDPKKVNEYGRCAFKIACKNNQLEIAKWLVSIILDNVKRDSHGSLWYPFHITDGLLNACMKGYIDIVKWILTDNLQYINMYIRGYERYDELYYYYGVAFRTACEYGHLELVKWLVSVKPNIKFSFSNEIFPPYYSDALRFACENGHLEVAKWLISIESEVVVCNDKIGRLLLNGRCMTTLENGSSFEKNNAFIVSCKNGHLEVAQWLFSIKPDIDISADDDYVFFIVCRRGYLEMAKWLLSVKPDIYITNNINNAFKDACVYNRWEIVQWLLIKI